MSSYLERQQAAFGGSLAAAATKIGSSSVNSKRPLAPPSPSPSISSITSAATGATPKKEKDQGLTGIAAANAFLPAQIDSGSSTLTQVTYVIKWLKDKDEPKTLQEIFEFINLQYGPEERQKDLAAHLRKNPHVEWIPDPNLDQQNWQAGTYAHRPTIPNVKTPTQLIAYLQKRTDIMGVAVKDLKDGWPDCEKAIDALEEEHRILVLRWKKDNKPKTVWHDDPTLFHPVDQEFKNMWAAVQIPGLDMMHARLTAVGQKPTSEDPRIKAAAAAKKVVKKKRQSNRAINTGITWMPELFPGEGEKKSKGARRI
jgi:transcription initiation factor TFIIE subunit beta